jgi:hypothetical protein
MVIRLDENFGDTPLSTKDTKSTNVKSPSTIWAAGGQAQVAALSLAKESGADWGWAKMLVLPPFFAPVKRHGKARGRFWDKTMLHSNMVLRFLDRPTFWK